MDRLIGETYASSPHLMICVLLIQQELLESMGAAITLSPEQQRQLQPALNRPLCVDHHSTMPHADLQQQQQQGSSYGAASTAYQDRWTGAQDSLRRQQHEGERQSGSSAAARKEDRCCFSQNRLEGLEATARELEEQNRQLRERLAARPTSGSTLTSNGRPSQSSSPVHI